MNKHFKIGESFTGDSPFPYLEVIMIDDGPDFPKLVVGGSVFGSSCELSANKL